MVSVVEGFHCKFEYSASSVIRTPLFMVDLGGVNVQVSEICPKKKNSVMVPAFLAQTWPGKEHGFLTVLSKPKI